MHYQYAVKDLFRNYYYSNPEKAPDFKDHSQTYIDFRFATQVMETDEGKKYILFPVVKVLHVESVVVAVIEADNTKIDYFYPEHNEIVENAIELFSQALASRGPGFDLDNPALIEEVVITVPVRNPSFLMNPIVSYNPLPPAHLCGVHFDCSGGGAINVPQITPPQNLNNPCAKSKLISASATNKQLFNTLKGQTTSSGAENAYLIYPNGTYDYKSGITSGIGQGELNLSFTGGAVDAVLHSHYAGLFSTFSVSDIFAIAAMYKQGVINNTQTFVFGVVTASGTQYLLVIDDIAKFSNFANMAISNGLINENIQRIFEYTYANLGISTSNTIQNNESLFTQYIEQNNLGLKMMKGSADFSNWSTLNAGSSPTNCP